jgi:hypothetical protein
MSAAIDGADQPSTTKVLEELLEVINHTFDFQKKVSVNMELMQSNTARMAMYGIAISIPQLTLTLITNIENATKAKYGCIFDPQCRLFAKQIHVQQCTRCHLTAGHFERAGRQTGCVNSKTHQHQEQAQHTQLLIQCHICKQ